VRTAERTVLQIRNTFLSSFSILHARNGIGRCVNALNSARVCKMADLNGKKACCKVKLIFEVEKNEVLYIKIKRI
jgi:hypothetical protein